MILLVLAAFTVFLAFFAGGSACLPLIPGILLWLPKGIRFFQYLFTSAYADLGMSLETIAGKGYAWSDFLTSWNFREGDPGLGHGTSGRAGAGNLGENDRRRRRRKENENPERRLKLADASLLFRGQHVISHGIMYSAWEAGR